MTRPAWLSPLLKAALFYAVSLFLGFGEVNGTRSALPTWFYAYSVLPALLLVGVEPLWEKSKGRPVWGQIVLRGLAWGLPVTAMMLGQEWLKSPAPSLGVLLRFVIVYLVVAVVIGGLWVPLMHNESVQRQETNG